MMAQIASLYIQYVPSYHRKMLTSDDLSKCPGTSPTVPRTSMVAYERMILKEWRSFDEYSRNRKHLLIFPLTYNREGHVTYLTLGHTYDKFDIYIL